MPKTKYNSTPQAIYAQDKSYLSYSIVNDDGVLIGARIKINSVQWFTWLNSEHDDKKRFYVDSMPYEYTARRETRKNSPNKHYWYAYKKFNDRLYKVYMGQSAKLDSEYIFQTIPQKLKDKINDKPIKP